MKKLSWKRKKYEDLTIWMSEIQTVGWQFSIEKTSKGYQPFVYYGRGEDIPLIDGIFTDTLKEAKDICNSWLYDLIVNINKWY